MPKSKPSISYNRAPSEKLLDLLKPDAFLRPLIDLNDREVCGLALDVHFRPNNEVAVYCGLTSLVKIRRSGNGTIELKSSKKYAEQSCAKGLFRPGKFGESGGKYLCGTWRIGERDFPHALDSFLANVNVDASQRKEGAIHASWSRVCDPWIPFDKEAALSYDTKEGRKEHLAEVFCSVDEVHRRLEYLVQLRRSLPNKGNHWQVLPSWKEKERLKLDGLAVDSAGKLVLVEFKDASASGVYYAPFQLLHNIWEWYCAFDRVRGSLQRLLDVRKDLGLTRACASPITGGIRAAVCFGCDRRSEEVKCRYEIVLDIVNDHLPPSVDPIETWEYGIGGPRLLR